MDVANSCKKRPRSVFLDLEKTCETSPWRARHFCECITGAEAGVSREGWKWLPWDGGPAWMQSSQQETVLWVGENDVLSGATPASFLPVPSIGVRSRASSACLGEEGQVVRRLRDSSRGSPSTGVPQHPCPIVPPTWHMKPLWKSSSRQGQPTSSQPCGGRLQQRVGGGLPHWSPCPSCSSLNWERKCGWEREEGWSVQGLPTFSPPFGSAFPVPPGPRPAGAVVDTSITRQGGAVFESCLGHQEFLS